MEPYQQLEVEWAKFNDLDPAGMVACSSGTAALHLALEALHLPPRSEVIVPDYTMVACARAVTLAGLVPVFVDCDERLLMDPKRVREAVNSSVPYLEQAVSAIIVVHIYGRRLESLGSPLGWPVPLPKVIEDLAEAHGVKPHPSTDAAGWSFYKNKIVAGEEGGAVWFRDPEHAALARQLRNLGFTDAHDFSHAPRGHNYRMSNAHAKKVLENFEPCMGFEGLRNWTSSLEKVVQERRRIESWYQVACPVEWRMPPREAPWVYDLRIPQLTVEGQGHLVRELNRMGIAARHGFKPMSRQEEYKNCKRVVGFKEMWSSVSGWTGMSKADNASREVIYLPIQPGVTTEAYCKRAFEFLVNRVLGRVPH